MALAPNTGLLSTKWRLVDCHPGNEEVHFLKRAGNPSAPHPYLCKLRFEGKRSREHLKDRTCVISFGPLFSGVILFGVATVNYNPHFAECRDSQNLSISLAWGFAMS